MNKATLATDKKNYLLVEGNIGTGKSTFLTLLKNYLPATIVHEPHELWQNIGGENLLEAFYKDTPRWAYTFQSYAFISRLLEQDRAALSSDNQLVILERSVYSDRYCFAKNCYETGLMTSLEWKLYQEWFKWLSEKYAPIPSAFIYLRTQPEISYKRIVQRNRSEESTIDFSYIEKIHAQHEAWLIDKEGITGPIKEVPVLVLDCDTDFKSNRKEQEKHVENIVTFCNDILYKDQPALKIKKDSYDRKDRIVSV